MYLLFLPTSMASFSAGIFGLVCVEVVAVLLMIAPLPGFMRSRIVHWIGESSIVASLQRPLRYLGFTVLVSFIFTIMEMHKYSDEYHKLSMGISVELASKLQAEVKKFHAERNFYLTGACCLLLLVMFRIYSQLKELNRLDATSTALKKQAENNASAYKVLQTEKEDLEKKRKQEGGLSDGPGSDEEIARLRKRVDTLADERRSAEKNAETLKLELQSLKSEKDRLVQV